MKVTKYGEELKMLRIKEGVFQNQMAQELGITSSLLSAVESGSRRIPVGLTDDIVRLYGLDEKTAAKLKKLEMEGERTAVQINLKKVEGDESAKTAVLLFAEKFADLSEEQSKNIIEILKNTKSKEGGERIE